MSRIGNAPVQIPTGVTVEKAEGKLVVKGPKGTLTMDLLAEVQVEVADSVVTVKRKNNAKKSRAVHGLTRSLIANLVTGVSQGWEKKLELVGVGFRVQAAGDKLTLTVGYSHPVVVEAPEGINFEVSDNTKIKVSGIDKQLVGQVAADIKKVRRPDVYKGKGIRYQGEYIRKKAGKSGKAGAK